MHCAVGFASGALLMLGSLLDWSGVSYSSDFDRAAVFTAGALMIVLAAGALWWRPRLLAFALAPAVLGLNMAVVNFTDIDGRLYEYAHYPDASVGIGIYLVLVGATVALFLGAITVISQRWFGRPSSTFRK